MATLNLKVLTTGEEFEIPDIDFSTVTPSNIITEMRDTLPTAGGGMSWKLLKGSALVNQDETLSNLGFNDGDTAILASKVQGAFNFFHTY